MLTQTHCDPWNEWQHGVLTELRGDFREIIAEIHLQDIDWDAWRPFFEEGRSPRAAVDRALLRDL